MAQLHAPDQRQSERLELNANTTADSTRYDILHDVSFQNICFLHGTSWNGVIH
jgi:hypothetical protein